MESSSVSLQYIDTLCYFSFFTLFDYNKKNIGFIFAIQCFLIKYLTYLSSWNLQDHGFSKFLEGYDVGIGQEIVSIFVTYSIRMWRFTCWNSWWIIH